MVIYQVWEQSLITEQKQVLKYHECLPTWNASAQACGYMVPGTQESFRMCQTVNSEREHKIIQILFIFNPAAYNLHSSISFVRYVNLYVTCCILTSRSSIRSVNIDRMKNMAHSTYSIFSIYLSSSVNS